MSQFSRARVLRFAPARRAPCAPDQRESIPLTEAAERLLKRGIAESRAGRTDQALHLIDEALLLDRKNVEALLWRGALSGPDESPRYLEGAVALAPGSQRARAGLSWARQRAAVPLRAAAGEPAVRAAPTVATRALAAGRRQPAAPDMTGTPATILSVLVERPIVALVVAITILALLGTAALARTSGIREGDSGPSRPAVIATPRLAGDGLARTGIMATPTKQVKQTQAPARVTQAAAPLAVSFDQAWAAGNWPQVIAILDHALQQTPTDETLAGKKFTAHYKYAMQLVGQDRMDDAIAQFDKAVEINAMDADLLREKPLAVLYRDGSAALADADYDLAIPSFRMLSDLSPTYKDGKARLYRAYIGYAAELEQSGKRSDAYTYYQKAMYVDTKGAEAQSGLVRLKGAAPEPVRLGRKIEVDLTKQQVIVWEGNQVRWRFTASTGKSPANTRTGNFTILNKMPYATNSAKGWGMPYWMGIYQAGGTEDGFHALLRMKDGTISPTSALGRPYTYGCIMLSDEDEKTLYDWAMIGTPVWIHY